MANWNNLKASISNVIKTNGNKEITGQNLCAVLLSIVNNIGGNSTFAGAATLTTLPDSVDGPIFYLASTEGTYPNFNNITLAKGEIAFLVNASGTWEKRLIGASKSYVDEIDIKYSRAVNTQNESIAKLELDMQSTKNSISAISKQLKQTEVEITEKETSTTISYGKDRIPEVKVLSSTSNGWEAVIADVIYTTDGQIIVSWKTPINGKIIIN